MDENNFEGTLVLEKLAEVGKVEDFFDAIDSDDFDQAKLLMKAAGIDSESIKIVLRKMSDSEDEH
jgi:hypothetical protein